MLALIEAAYLHGGKPARMFERPEDALFSGESREEVAHEIFVWRLQNRVTHASVTFSACERTACTTEAAEAALVRRANRLYGGKAPRAPQFMRESVALAYLA